MVFAPTAPASNESHFHPEPTGNLVTALRVPFLTLFYPQSYLQAHPEKQVLKPHHFSQICIILQLFHRGLFCGAARGLPPTLAQGVPSWAAAALQGPGLAAPEGLLASKAAGDEREEGSGGGRTTKPPEALLQPLPL